MPPIKDILAYDSSLSSSKILRLFKEQNAKVLHQFALLEDDTVESMNESQLPTPIASSTPAGVVVPARSTEVILRVGKTYTEIFIIFSHSL